MPLIADSIRNLSASLTVMAIVIAGLLLGRDVLIPLALATLLAFILAPIVRALVARRVPRGLSVTAVMISVVIIIVGASALFSAQMLSLTAELGTYKANLVEKARTLSGSGSTEGVIKRAVDSVDALEKEIKREWSRSQSQPEGKPGESAPVVVTRESGSDAFWSNVHVVGAPLAQAALTFLFTLFLLLQHNDLRDRVVRVVGTDNMSEVTAAMGDAGERLSQLFLMQAGLNAGFGVFIALALWLIGVPNPVLWGVVTFLMRFVPFVGSFISAIPPLLMAASVEPGWATFVATLLTFAIGEPLMGHIIEPFVLGRRAGLSPFSMVAAASFWTLIWGPVGLLLAAPITMAVVVLGRYVPGLEFLSVLLGDEPALKPEQEFYHRILSGDAIAAAEQVENTLAESSLADASDKIVLSGLGLAAADHRRARLEPEQIASLKSGVAQVSELLADAVDERPTTDRAASHTLLIPARGPIDLTATRFVADIMGLSACGTSHTAGQGSGLTALSDAKAEFKDTTFDSIVVVTVGGIDQQHLRFIIRRARRDFSSARLVVLDWGRSAEGVDFGDEVVLCTKLVEVMGALDCARKPETPREPEGLGMKMAVGLTG